MFYPTQISGLLSTSEMQPKETEERILFRSQCDHLDQQLDQRFLKSDTVFFDRYTLWNIVSPIGMTSVKL